jgi:hypothetical protein
MSEVQLQGLLDRTDHHKVVMKRLASARMYEKFQRFNTEHVGEDSVFPRRNSVPKILEQFNDKPHTLETIA